MLNLDIHSKCPKLYTLPTNLVPFFYRFSLFPQQQVGLGFFFVVFVCLFFNLNDLNQWSSKQGVHIKNLWGGGVPDTWLSI